MNAHIHLDLGIFTAQVTPNEPLADLNRINTVLASLVGVFQADLAWICPLPRTLSRNSGSVDDVSINLSMEKAFDAARQRIPLDREEQEWEIG